LRNRQHVLQADSLPEKGLLPLELSIRSSFPQKRLPAPGGGALCAAKSSRWIIAAFLFWYFHPNRKEKKTLNALAVRKSTMWAAGKTAGGSSVPVAEKFLNTVSKIERSKALPPELFRRKRRFGTVFAR